MLTISKLKRWSINYYIDTAQAAEHAARDMAQAGGGLREYYSNELASRGSTGSRVLPCPGRARPLSPG